MKKLLVLLFSLFFLSSPSVFAKDISDCKIISDDTERLQCYDSLSVKLTQQEENSKNESVSNLKEEGIFFQVISKSKYEDADGDETCLTDFVVTNNTKYTLKFDDDQTGISWYDENISQYIRLVNPNLERTEVSRDDYPSYIEYFEPGMTANLQDTNQLFGPEYELSKLVAYKTKCKRVKKYVFHVACQFEVLDSNEDEIEWKSRKKEYTTILKLHKPHPDHDKKEFGKIVFKKRSC